MLRKAPAITKFNSISDEEVTEVKVSVGQAFVARSLAKKSKHPRMKKLREKLRKQKIFG